MRILFFGTDQFAKELLSFLLEKKLNVVAVVTRPDQPKGRSQKIEKPPVVEGYSGYVYQPVKVSDPEFALVLKGLNADLFVVVSYGQILKQNILDIPKYGTINVHPSLLPKYRGPSPIQSAVLAGEEETGVTIMEMELAMDAGGIIEVVKTKIPLDMTFGALEEHLVELAKDPLYRVIQKIEQAKQIKSIQQNESLATYTKKIHVEDSFIDWNRSSKEICDFVRGMNPRPGARMKIEGGKSLMKIFYVKPAPYQGEAGKVIFFDQEHGLIIACQNGAVALLEVQLEGKKRMAIKDFINGFAKKINI